MSDSKHPIEGNLREPKKSYNAPSLTVYGSVGALTMGMTFGASVDAMGMPMV